jgi:hypothetical protein
MYCAKTGNKIKKLNISGNKQRIKFRIAKQQTGKLRHYDAKNI